MLFDQDPRVTATQYGPPLPAAAAESWLALGLNRGAPQSAVTE
jgi:hypothetical protein